MKRIRKTKIFFFMVSAIILKIFKIEKSFFTCYTTLLKHKTFIFSSGAVAYSPLLFKFEGMA
jgi:hypothetical protein